MRPIIWIGIFSGILVSARFAFTQFDQRRFTAHPRYIEEFREEQAAALSSGRSVQTNIDDECQHIPKLDWNLIISQNSTISTETLKELPADSILWQLKLRMLAIVGMEYELYEVESLSASQLTYFLRRYLESEPDETGVKDLQVADFKNFYIKKCGDFQVQPLFYFDSPIGQLPLRLSDRLIEDFMNDPNVREQIGKLLHQKFRINPEQKEWNFHDFGALQNRI